MAWTDPNLVSWDVGDILTSSDMRTYVRDNLLALKNRESFIYRSGTEYNTTSTVMTDVDASNIAYTINLSAPSDILVSFDATVRVTASNFMYFALRRDGGDLFAPTMYRTPNWEHISFSYVCEGLGPGTYTFGLQWRVAGGTGIIAAGRNQFVVKDLG